MLKRKATILTLILFFGFTTHHCNPCQCPDFKGNFFDIQGMRVIQYQKGISNNSIIALGEHEQIHTNQYQGFAIRYLVDYISLQSSSGIFTGGLSLIPAAMACD